MSGSRSETKSPTIYVQLGIPVSNNNAIINAALQIIVIIIASISSVFIVVFGYILYRQRRQIGKIKTELVQVKTNELKEERQFDEIVRRGKQ